MKRMRWLSPTSLVYMLVHMILFLLGFLLVKVGGILNEGIGASLIATAVTGWVVFVYIRLSERRSEMLEIMSHFGFVAAFEGRAARIKGEYDQRLTRAREGIDVMGFGLKALWEDYHEHFDEWKGRANVRILLMDPASPYADQRDTEESEIVGTIRQSVERFLQQTEPLRAKRGAHRFDIRLYTCLPSVNIFRVDDQIFWGPYLIRSQSRNAPTFIVQSGGVLYRRLRDHFDTIWTTEGLSRSVRPEDMGE